MSYRSFKRVLGETSLERKCRFLFGACLLLLITGSFLWYGKETEKLVFEQNPTKGRLLVDQVMLVEHWKGLETRQLDPDSLPWEGVTQNEGGSELVDALANELSKNEYKWRFIIKDDLTPAIAAPGEKKQPLDLFEKELLTRFLKAPAQDPSEGEPAEFDERWLPDRNEYQYYQVVRAKEKCLLCHKASGESMGGVGGLPTYSPALGNVTARNAGDLLAVVRVTIPNGPTQEALEKNWGILGATAIVTVLLAMIALYVIVRYVIVKPLKHLRDVSDEISHGNITLRADIHTGDEFESLAISFNRMLRHLIDAQEELRDVNDDLDGKVDELAQANMQLYEMNRLKSDFLATMSHELRTPLNSILGFSDVLGSIDALNEKQKRYVLNIQKSGRTLLEMINDILDLAKMESGKMELRLSDFRVEQVIGAQCDMARPLTERKNIDLELDLAPDLPELHQDQARVQQILNNLLSNAIKFTPEGGRILVSAGQDVRAAELVVTVADTGVGIAEEDRQTIFEMFRQGRTAVPSGDTMTREHSGTGLGLSIVMELCKLLSGSVSLESELGKGSLFTVRLPVRLTEQPRLDSPLAEGFEQFSKPRLEFHRDRGKSPQQPQV
ncbi:MAG: HAMP domain-containing protein [Planctomycetes bacterium]|nr:HAMP domain-containing protein [Planctomycetota bacterium]